MFGYLQIHKSELLVREYEAYKAVYCGLCKQMGKDYSVFARLSLSYDCTFYAMLLMSLDRSCSGFTDGRCTFNPFKKCKFANCRNDSYKKAAAFSIILTYYKLKDNIADENFIKSLLCRLILPFFSHWKKKATKDYLQIDNIVSDMMLKQISEEKSNNSTIDSAAHPTADMLSKVLLLEAENDMQKNIYYELGYHLGRWIYLIDAADDLLKDKKNKSFNPFINKTDDSLIAVESIEAVLNQSLARAYDAYNLINVIDFQGILDNMILKGFPMVQNRIINKLYEEAKNEKSI